MLKPIISLCRHVKNASSQLEHRYADGQKVSIPKVLHNSIVPRRSNLAKSVLKQLTLNKHSEWPHGVVKKWGMGEQSYM